ncbi:hypothetical protein BCA37_05930 [Mycobacterium sp. djl-10]|jgi:hypothetical protein|nr:hypothetical protein BCA37_05930 [Mycobacterium sp. djl-10]
MGAADVGDTAMMLVIPVVGLILLSSGIWRQRHESRASPPPPGAPSPQPVPHSGPDAIATVLILLGSGLLVLGLAATALAALGPRPDSTRSARLSLSTPTAAAHRLHVGECITDRQYAVADMSPRPTDCADPDAVYELAYQAEGPSATCPDGFREDSGYAVLFNNSHTYCFVLNVDEGECFSVLPEADLFRPVDCTDPDANTRIDKILDGAEDLALCPAGPQGASFPQPARTYCVVSPG